MHCLFHIKILLWWNGTRAIRNFSWSTANRWEAQRQGGIHLEAVSGFISILNQQAQAFSGLAAFFSYIGGACWGRRFGLPPTKGNHAEKSANWSPHSFLSWLKSELTKPAEVTINTVNQTLYWHVMFWLPSQWYEVIFNLYTDLGDGI